MKKHKTPKKRENILLHYHKHQIYVGGGMDHLTHESFFLHGFLNQRGKNTIRKDDQTQVKGKGIKDCEGKIVRKIHFHTSKS